VGLAGRRGALAVKPQTVCADEPEVQTSRRAIALTAAAIYAGAAILGIFEGLLPGSRAATTSLAAGGIALLIAAFLATVGPRLPRRVLFVFGPLGALLIACALGSPQGYGDGAILYVWPAVWAAYFYGTRGTVAIVVCIGAVHAGLLLSLPPEQANVDRWLDVEVAVIVVAAVVRVLAARSERLVRQLAWESRADPLTGLLNRRGLDERLAAELSRAGRDDACLACVQFDLDHFKGINDRYGHDVGDRVLVWVGAIILTESRGADVAARAGGEEFVVLLPATSRADARAFAERVRRVVEAGPGARHRDGIPDDLTVTISAGVSAARAPESADALLLAADAALYRAKAAGRNRVVVDEGPQARVTRARRPAAA